MTRNQRFTLAVLRTAFETDQPLDPKTYGIDQRILKKLHARGLARPVRGGWRATLAGVNEVRSPVQGKEVASD